MQPGGPSSAAASPPPMTEAGRKIRPPPSGATPADQSRPPRRCQKLVARLSASVHKQTAPRNKQGIPAPSHLFTVRQGRVEGPSVVWVNAQGPVLPPRCSLRSRLVGGVVFSLSSSPNPRAPARSLLPLRQPCSSSARSRRPLAPQRRRPRSLHQLKQSGSSARVAPAPRRRSRLVEPRERKD